MVTGLGMLLTDLGAKVTFQQEIDDNSVSLFLNT